MCIRDSLNLNYASGSSGTYNLSSGILWANKDELIGNYGTGTFTQSGGTHTVTGSLYLGCAYGGSGTYNLSDTGSLSVNRDELIGYSGTGTFTQSGGSHTVAYNLDLGYNSSGNGTYNLSSGSLRAYNEIIGYSGTGTFTQSGGTNTVTGALNIGYASGSSGTYNLSSGNLSAGNEYIGNSSTGTFTQSGGIHTVIYNLSLGNNSSGNGTYGFSSGNLSARNEFIGNSGTGTFTQSGGTHMVAYNLDLGYNSSGNGTYNLSSGSLSADNEYVGYSGTGTFTQSGGTNTVSGTIYIAMNTGSRGTYELSGGTLTAVGGIVNNDTFTQSGGTVDGNLQNNGTFTYSGGTFSKRLINNGTVSFNADFTAGNGMEHNTDLTIGAGRTITLNGLGLTNNGTITITGGTLNGNGPLVNSAYISGYGTIGGTGGFVNNAFFTQNGGDIMFSNTGANINYGNMDLASGRQFQLNGSTLTNAASFNLNSSIVKGTGTLINTYRGIVYGKGVISSNFSNEGGILLVENGATSITKDFNNSGLIQMAGNSASLAGGIITNIGKIEGFGNVGNGITNTGTIEAKNGTLILAGTVNNNTGGRIAAGTGNEVFVSKGLASNAGIINLTGGTFDNNNKAMTNSGQISGYGTFSTGGLSNTGSVTFTGTNGSTTTINGNVTNETVGKMEVAYNPAIFTGNVTNYGIFKSTETTVKFTGTYTENGTYTSDPSNNYFETVTIGTGGVWTGGEGDSFNIYKDIINNSTQNTLWGTNQALLGFAGSNDHNFALAGSDLGATMSGYINNFAWDTLSIEGSIFLADGNEISGCAQYVRSILGAALSGDTVTNIYGNGFNIYYLASAEGNKYLNGQTYNLADGGLLIPIGNPVPVPPAIWLLGTGLAGLIGIRRKFIR